DYYCQSYDSSLNTRLF
nr:immunoglobulin light chain junction region [Macaca mulatta]MOX17042.1 immunoglobulin light chain junction region [Macaca mulatta]MOX17449.1 immunoglobulin light chain junction region [Macaca mulatta]MOX17718.1 immunoglobulin light chain junction region [Macaca mulatta]MOX18711.1 immunoglobulin light chain junction region [Macaca mulatta]